MPSSTDPVLLAAYVPVLGGMGLIVGSFLNVVIYRVPRGLSIVSPGSSCPNCHTEITPRDNVPVLSWLLLRGRCRTCGEPISMRYPLVEITNAVVWLILGSWAWRPGGIDPLLPLLLILGSAGLALWFIDLEHHRLPNAIVLPLYPVTIVGLAFAGLVSDDWPLTSCILGAGIWLALIGGLWLVTGGRGMGLGDVKLAPVLGATLGWVGLAPSVVGLLLAFVFGGTVGIVLMATGRAKRGSHIPFGPFLLLGSAVGLLAGQAVWEGYQQAIGL